MKKFSFLNLFFLAAAAVCSFSNAAAQTPDQMRENNGGNRRAVLLDELELSPEQLQQYRRINAERRPFMRAAQQRLKEANRALDQAVYADAPNEADVQMRIKEVQTAQAEVVKIRTQNELAVRRILTVPQLIRFREARRKFAEAVEEKRADKRENRKLNQPNRKFVNRRQRRAAAVPNN